MHLSVFSDRVGYVVLKWRFTRLTLPIPAIAVGIRVGLALLDILRDHILARRQHAVQLLLSPLADLLSVPCFISSLLTMKLPDRTFKKATKWAHGQCPLL